MSQPYFGPPDADHYCAHTYRRMNADGDLVDRPDLHCPNYINFLIRVPGEPDKPACFEHLAEMIWEHGLGVGAFAPTIFVGE